MSTLNAGTLNISGTLNLPSYSVAQRDALSKTTGMIIYNNEDGGIEVWDGGGWGAGCNQPTQTMAMSFVSLE